MGFPSHLTSCFALALLLAGGLPGQESSRVTLEAAFEPATASPGDEVVLRVVVQIESGWHIYGSLDKTSPSKLEVADAGGLEVSGKAVVPPGKPHESFGVRNYWLEGRQVLRQRFRVPPSRSPGSVQVRGTLAFMPCTPDYCEPPTRQEFAATLTVTAAVAAAANQDPGADPIRSPAAGGAVPGLPELPGGESMAAGKLFLEPSIEPQPARPGERVRLTVRVIVEEGWHVYGSRETKSVPTTLRLDRLGGLEPVAPAQVPPGTAVDSFGEEAFHLEGTFEITQVLQVPQDAAPGEIELAGVVDHLPCDPNVCLDRAEAPFAAKLRIEEGPARDLVPLPDAVADAGSGGTTAGSQRGAGSGSGAGFASLWLLLLACVGGGLFALAMPCTYPMIPITFSFFAKQAEKRGGAVLPLALAYGVGIVLMFSLIGAFAGAVAPWINAFANHWLLNSLFAAAFLFFALVLFGWINLQPPQSLMQAAGSLGRTGGYLGVFFMGATLVITSFTCTAPIVGSVLLAGTQGLGTAEVTLGMAVFGLTMAIPFVVLSLLPGRVKQLPRSGEWMDALKVTLGFVEVAAALKFLSNVDLALGWGALPRELFLLSWAAVFLLAALYLFGLIRARGSAFAGVGGGRLGAGVATFLLAFYCLYGAMGFRLDFVMTSLAPPYSAETVLAGRAGGESRGHRLVKDDYERALAVAKTEDKLLLVNITGFN